MFSRKPRDFPRVLVEVGGAPQQTARASDGTDPSWFVLEFHRCSHIVDAMLVLPLKAPYRGKRTVCIGFHNSELMAGADGDNKIAARAEALLRDHLFVHVRVVPGKSCAEDEPIPASRRAVVVNGQSFTYHEVFVTHETIRVFSPMIAYSGLDVYANLMEASME